MENPSKFERAQKRVNQIKGFYSHLTVYIVINIFIVIWSAVIFKEVGEPSFQWPMLSTPILWGIGLGIHALTVFGRTWIFDPKWEQRQIRKIIDAEEKASGIIQEPSKKENRG
jgi:hypothetical protein